MDSWSNYCNRPTSPSEQILYAHLMQCVENKTPDEAINRFRRLFIDARGYADHDVWRALGQIVDGKNIDREFKYILNRSCYILINRWLMQPRLHSYIGELIETLESPPCGLIRSRSGKRLRTLINDFLTSEQYLSLKRLSQLVGQGNGFNRYDTVPLGTLIHRYPALYEYSLLTEDSGYEQRKRIKTLRRQAQKQFEVDLSQYLTHRQLYVVRNGYTEAIDLNGNNGNGNSAVALKNPTLLTDRQVDDALIQFAGKVDGSNTHRDLAKQFLTYGKMASSYREFKNDLYDYLISYVDPKYGRHHFNQQLRQCLADILPHFDSYQVTDFLLVETCKKLVSFLTIESLQQTNHSRFVDLVSNLGTVLTITLLLKIVLLCRTVKPWLERRFSILFNIYEASTVENVRWLVEALEHFNLAICTNFGMVKFAPSAT